MVNPEILKRGGRRISPVIIYRKCKQRTIRLLCTGKRQLIWRRKKSEPTWGIRPQSPLPLESATETTYAQLGVMCAQYTCMLRNAAPKDVLHTNPSTELHLVSQSDHLLRGMPSNRVGKKRRKNYSYMTDDIAATRRQMCCKLVVTAGVCKWQ